MIQSLGWSLVTANEPEVKRGRPVSLSSNRTVADNEESSQKDCECLIHSKKKSFGSDSYYLDSKFGGEW